MKGMLLSAAILAVLAMTLPACGAGAGPTPSSTPSPTPTGGTGTPTPAPAINEQVVRANNTFAFALFTELGREQAGSNLFVSPLSIAMALAMTYNGAAGDTQAAMAQALHLMGMDREAVNQGNAALLQALSGRGPEMELNVVNSIWSREGYPFEQAFLDQVKGPYQAEVVSLPFDNAAKDRINGWVQDHTNGKIDSILSSINPSDVMYLINAIYFKGTWTYQFQEQNTKDGSFYNADGSQAQVPMMHQSVQLDYLEGNGFTALRLPYQGGASMYVFLPDQGSSLSQFLGELNGASWGQWMNEFKQEGQVNITLPRFQLAYEATLNDALKAMGMGIAFDPVKADFTDMGPSGLYISQVLHKTRLEVYEKGSEAAAVTSVVIADSAAMQSFDFNVDRPFFLAITDDRTGSVLFTGAVEHLGS